MCTTTLHNNLAETTYISKVYNHDTTIPYLSRDEERELLEAYIINGDMSARERLIIDNLSYVIRLARTLSGYRASLSDLIQEGNVGLIKALNNFTLEHDVRFYTHALHYVKSEMYKFALKNDKIYNIATTKAQRKLFYGLRRFKVHGGHFTTKEINNISNELNVKPELVRDMEFRLQQNSVISTDAPPETRVGAMFNEAASMPLIDMLATDTEQPDTALINSDSEQHLSSMMYASLKSLDTRSKDIVRRRWLDSEKSTLSVLAKEYGVSIERIRQIEAQALRKMRMWLVN